MYNTLYDGNYAAIQLFQNYFLPQKESSPYHAYKYTSVLTLEVHIPLGLCGYSFPKVRM